MAQRKRTDSQATQTLQRPSISHASVALASLAPHPRNYRRHPEQQLGRIAASLARFGQVRSIVVQEGAPGRYLIVAGHGVVEAARGQDMTELHADIIPADWTPEQVEGYLVADNMGGADDDLVRLAELLEGQQHAGYDLESVGYDADELQALLDGLADGALTPEIALPDGEMREPDAQDDHVIVTVTLDIEAWPRVKDGLMKLVTAHGGTVDVS